MRPILVAAVSVAFLVVPSTAPGHGKSIHPAKSLVKRERQLEQRNNHNRYVCKHGRPGAFWTRGHCKRWGWSRKSLRGVRERLRARQAPSRSLASTGGIQAAWIAAATELAHISGGDPWPSCPDPFWSGGSWGALKDCESRGYSWSVCLTPSGFVGPFQFHPGWRSLWRRHGIGC